MAVRPKPLIFLQSILAAKTKTRLNEADFQRIFQQAPLVLTMSERGMFILLVAQILQKQYISFEIALRRFITDLEFREKRVRNQDDQPPKKRKKTQLPIGSPLSIEEMSNESLAHPENIQLVRKEELLKSGEDSSNAINSKSSQGSKDSKEIGFKEELKKISEALRGAEETEGMDMGNGHQFHVDFEPESSSVDRSQGLISNINQKLKILGEQSYKQNELRTRRKNTATKNKGTATKKKSSWMIDERTMLDGSIRSMLDQSLNKTIPDFEQVEVVRRNLDFQNSLREMEITIFRKEDILSENALGKLRNYLNFQESPLEFRRDLDTDFVSDFPEPNYSLEQTSLNSLKMEGWSTIQQNKIPLEFAQGHQVSIQSISHQTNKKAAHVLYEMLWRCQKGQVEILQANPAQFSAITIRNIQS